MRINRLSFGAPMSLLSFWAGLHLGCSAGETVSPAPPPPPPVPVASVSISPGPSFSVIAGSTRQLYATLRDAQGNSLGGRTVNWTSSAPGVATVSIGGVDQRGHPVLGGLVTAMSAGVAQIRATSEGITGEVTVTVTPNPWSTTGFLNFGRYLPSATLLADGRVLVAGGHLYTSLVECELYDPGTGMWTLTGSMGTARVNHVAVRLANGKILVAGGYGNGAEEALASAEIYDPATATWSPTGEMLSPRAEHSAVLLPDGTVLVMGGSSGYTELNPLDSSEIYDPTTGTWTFAGQMNAARGGGQTSLLLSSGRVLTAGGFGGTLEDRGPQLVQMAETFDPGTRTWSATGDLGTPRMYHQMVLLRDGRALVTGGLLGWSQADASVELYNPGTGLWAPTQSMTWAREGHTATVLSNGAVLVVGGFDWDEHEHEHRLLRAVEIYDPVTGTWSATGNLPEGHIYHAAVRLANGKVLVIGGGSGSDPNRVDIFDPTVAFSGAQLGSPR